MSTRARSAKAIGKQRAIEPQPEPIKTTARKTSKESNVEKRVTRGAAFFTTESASTLGLNEAGPSTQRYHLPGSTSVLITVDETLPQDYYPPYELYQPEVITEEAVLETIEVPQFRQLADAELSTRTRRGRSEEMMDTSDAAYIRRHRGPEILEKRAKKQEVENLSQERNRLRAVLERIRLGENAVHTLWTMLHSSIQMHVIVLPEGSTADEERQAKAAEMDRVKRLLVHEAEATLRRYDDLLKPRQPSPIPPSATLPTQSSQQTASEQEKPKRKDPQITVEPPTVMVKRKKDPPLPAEIPAAQLDAAIQPPVTGTEAEQVDSPKKRKRLIVPTRSSKRLRPSDTNAIEAEAISVPPIASTSQSPGQAELDSPAVKGTKKEDATQRRSPRRRTATQETLLAVEETEASEAEVAKDLLVPVKAPRPIDATHIQTTRRGGTRRRSGRIQDLAFNHPLPSIPARDFSIDDSWKTRRI